MSPTPPPSAAADESLGQDAADPAATLAHVTAVLRHCLVLADQSAERGKMGSAIHTIIGALDELAPEVAQLRVALRVIAPIVLSLSALAGL